MAEAKKAEVAKKETGNAIAMTDLLKKTGPSLSERTTEDFAIPYLNIIGDTSPQIDKEDSEHIPGAEAGMIFNNVTDKAYKEITVLPVYYRRRYVEWAERGEGPGAPVNIYTPLQFEQMKREGKVVRGEDNKERIVGGDTYIENTAEHYVIVMEPDGMWSKAIIKMKSTQLKKSRTWNSIMSNQRRVDGNEVYQPKDFARSYILKTIREKNDKGKWFGWVISEGVWIDELNNPNIQKVYEDAMMFEKQIHSGEVDSAPQREDEKVAPQGASAETSTDLPF
tara:strand:+ start:5409 stop:6248 length:840 start_codon:yes stop_codon:yes gene_type:complete